MPVTKRKFTPEFKEKLIKEAIETGNASLVARQYEISPSLLSRWVRQYKNPQNNNTLTKESKITSHADIKALEDENNTLKKLLGEKDLEIAILKDLLKKPTNDSR
ncbi:transposase [Fonticella tunisiensis]|uniref:Transposase n=1 Tax=Fonticella tunisiensis TaxID=1096341 RepID=A0A4V3ESI6_9CLOT|nr:transposase [Fonticella tunisiensis]TDT51970.1 transposase [Fonticella tunisiensis]